jgi:hypothetical protein
VAAERGQRHPEVLERLVQTTEVLQDRGALGPRPGGRHAAQLVHRVVDLTQRLGGRAALHEGAGQTHPRFSEQLRHARAPSRVDGGAVVPYRGRDVTQLDRGHAHRPGGHTGRGPVSQLDRGAVDLGRQLCRAIGGHRGEPQGFLSSFSHEFSPAFEAHQCTSIAGH